MLNLSSEVISSPITASAARSNALCRTLNARLAASAAIAIASSHGAMPASTTMATAAPCASTSVAASIREGRRLILDTDRHPQCAGHHNISDPFHSCSSLIAAYNAGNPRRHWYCGLSEQFEQRRRIEDEQVVQRSYFSGFGRHDGAWDQCLLCPAETDAALDLRGGGAGRLFGGGFPRR